MMNCLRLQTSAKGTVWFGDGSVMAVDSGLSAESFVASQQFYTAQLVRLLGGADNADLIEQMHNAKARWGGLPIGMKIQIGSPSMCRDPRSAADALGRVWHATICLDEPGEWYEMAESDYPAFALVAAVAANGDLPNDKARRIMRYHPAWAAMSFVPGHDVDACCRLLALIVDPRWFLHPQRSSRLSRLNSYLGLTPDNVVAALNGRAEGGRHYERFRLTAKAWLGHDPALLAAVGMSSLGDGDFLRRVYACADSRVNGLLRATEKFIRLVREVWLSQRSAEHKQLGFDPEMFFNSDTEVTAYLEHRLALQSVPGESN